MKVRYTYKNNYGIYYFRQVLSNHRSGPLEIRFSLRTRIPSEARVMAYRAWLCARSDAVSRVNSGLEVRAILQSAAFNNQEFSSMTIEQLNTGKNETPKWQQFESVSEHIESWEDSDIINAACQLANKGTRLVVPFAGGKCASYALTEVSDGEIEDQFVDYEYVPGGYVELSWSELNKIKTTSKSVVKIGKFLTNERGLLAGPNEEKYLAVPDDPLDVLLSEISMSIEEKHAVRFPHKAHADNQQKPLKKSKVRLIWGELEKFCQEKETGGYWTKKTSKEYRNKFKTFVEIVGDKNVEDLDSDDISHYVERLNFLPKNRNKIAEFKGLSALDASTINEELQLDTISLKTRKYYLESLSEPFRRFHEKGLHKFNLIANTIGFCVKEDAMDNRNPFSAAEFKQMIESDDSLKFLGAKNWKGSRAWGLLIAMHTGARAEEIFKLRIKDVVIDGVQTPYFDINFTDTGRLKNNHSIRQIPIHSKLIELGFFDFVQKSKNAQPNRKIPMLFADISNSGHGWHKNSTRWVNCTYLPKLGIKKEKICFYSFRHSVIDILKRSDLRSRVITRVLGQTDKGSPEFVGTYGSHLGPEDLVKVIESIQYEVDFTKLQENVLDNIKVRRHR